MLCTLSHICLGIISKSQIKIGFYFTQKMKPNPCFPGLQLCLTKETKTRNIWISESDLAQWHRAWKISGTHRERYSNISLESFDFYHERNLNHLSHNCLCWDLKCSFSSLCNYRTVGFCFHFRVRGKKEMEESGPLSLDLRVIWDKNSTIGKQ